jgi:hypothetical protein
MKCNKRRPEDKKMEGGRLLPALREREGWGLKLMNETA